MKQRFQFGGIGALFGYEIDVLVTPDPLFKPGLMFEPVFDYEQVLVVAKGHPLAGVAYVKPRQLVVQACRKGCSPRRWISAATAADSRRASPRPRKWGWVQTPLTST